MDADNPALLALVRAVSDGAAVDWDSATSGASDSFRAAIAELRIVADLANLHRSLSAERDHQALATRSISSHAPGPSLARWGHLHLLDHLASGSFGDVYRAWDPAIDREVALKLLRARPSPVRDDDGTIEEGRLLARVRHPNVVTVFGAARIEGRVGIWMEFVRGRTLAALVEQDGPLPAPALVQLGSDLCNAVAAVHDAGLLHRDIKAQNVMLGDDRRLVLMDFGAGRSLAGPHRDVAGTPLYLAPELLGGQEATVRSDVYSLGVLLHFLATASFPRFPRAVAARLTIPTPLDAVIARAMAPDPSARFANAGELGESLRGTVPSPRTNRPLLLMAGAAALVAALAVAVSVRHVLGSSSPAGAVALAGGEAQRKLAWPAQVAPTGPPSRDGRVIGAVDWQTSPGVGLPVVVDLASNDVHRLRDATAADVAAGAYTASSAIAPDSARIAFAWSVPDAEDATELRVCALDGSDARMVYREPHSDLHVVGWSATGDEVLLRRHAPGRESTLLWVRLSGGAPRPVLRVPSASFLSLNPNGRDLVLDWPQPGAPEKRDLMVADLLTAELRPLLAEPENDAMPVWVPDGHRVLFASDRAGTFGAWLIDTAKGEAGEPQQVRSSLGTWQPVGFGTRGELYYEAQTGTVDVYTARIDLRTGTTGPRQAIPTSFRGRNLFGDWSPDSRHLAFTSRRGPINFGPSSQYVVIREMGSTVERVLPTPFDNVGPPRWGPDGTRIAVPVSNPTPAVSLLDVASGRVERSWSTAGNAESLDWLSPDRLAFVVRQATGTVLHVVSPSSGADDSVARDVTAITVSAARDWIAFLVYKDHSMRVMVAASDAMASWREVFRAPAAGPGVLTLAGWTPDDAYVVAVRPATSGSGGQVLLGIPADGGAPVDLAHVQLGEGARSIRLSPDGSLLSFEAGRPAVTTWVLEHPLLTP